MLGTVSLNRCPGIKEVMLSDKDKSLGKASIVGFKFKGTIRSATFIADSVAATIDTVVTAAATSDSATTNGCATSASMAIATSDDATATLLVLLTLLLFLLQQLMMTQKLEYAGGWIIIFDNFMYSKSLSQPEIEVKRFVIVSNSKGN